MPFAPTHFSPRVSLATMSFHVFSAIRELNFVEVQKITIMFFSTWKICQTFDPLISCSLRCPSTPSPDPHLPYFRGLERGALLDSGERQGKS